MKVLIINSDSPHNRGDRAILQGNIYLIKQRFPKAEIWSLSQFKKRDTKWYGINFLPYSATTTNPIHILKIALFARKCDYVFWGGGEMLKDYTTKINPLYWTLRMLPIWFLNKNIYGVFQGIGPTKSANSKKIIAFLVNRTKVFFVRDQESKEKLIAWGARAKIIDSYDPAILIKPTKLNTSTIKLVKESYNISPDFLSNAAGVGLRKWFYYKESSWIPKQFRFWGDKQNKHNPKLDKYIKNVATIMDYLVEKHNLNIVFFPMFNSASERDDDFSRQIVSAMKHGDRTRIISDDKLSPQEYTNVIAKCKIFIASRLHASIIATVAGVPSMNFYYVDKGRLYFDQIGMQRFSQPIERLARTHDFKKSRVQIDDLVLNRLEIKKELSSNIGKMRKGIIRAFREGLNES